LHSPKEGVKIKHKAKTYERCGKVKLHAEKSKIEEEATD